MRRLSLFEFGDQPWLPLILREAETAYLAVSYRVLPLLARYWAGKIETALRPGQPAEILDLCSGAGGAMPAILDELRSLGYDVRATLTDLYPSPKSAAHERMTWLQEPVDATRVPAEFAGVRTMFSAYHHFPPDSARAILKDAFDKRCAICIFEAGSRATVATLGRMLGVPVAVLALMPSARPFRWGYLLFTYLIPVLPFMILWDGMVSLFRIYSIEEMRQLTAGLEAADYVWDIGAGQMYGMALPYLIGRPVDS